MTLYCGVDFHARQQTVAYCDTADGETRRGARPPGAHRRRFRDQAAGQAWQKNDWRDASLILDLLSAAGRLAREAAGPRGASASRAPVLRA